MYLYSLFFNFPNRSNITHSRTAMFVISLLPSVDRPLSLGAVRSGVAFPCLGAMRGTRRYVVRSGAVPYQSTAVLVATHSHGGPPFCSRRRVQPALIQIPCVTCRSGLATRPWPRPLLMYVPYSPLHTLHPPSLNARGDRGSYEPPLAVGVLFFLLYCHLSLFWGVSKIIAKLWTFLLPNLSTHGKPTRALGSIYPWRGLRREESGICCGYKNDKCRYLSN